MNEFAINLKVSQFSSYEGDGWERVNFRRPWCICAEYNLSNFQSVKSHHFKIIEWNCSLIRITLIAAYWVKLIRGLLDNWVAFNGICSIILILINILFFIILYILIILLTMICALDCTFDGSALHASKLDAFVNIASLQWKCTYCDRE